MIFIKGFSSVSNEKKNRKKKTVKKDGKRLVYLNAICIYVHWVHSISMNVLGISKTEKRLWEDKDNFMEFKWVKVGGMQKFFLGYFWFSISVKILKIYSKIFWGITGFVEFLKGFGSQILNNISISFWLKCQTLPNNFLVTKLSQSSIPTHNIH